MLELKKWPPNEELASCADLLDPVFEAFLRKFRLERTGAKRSDYAGYELGRPEQVSCVLPDEVDADHNDGDGDPFDDPVRWFALAFQLGMEQGRRSCLEGVNLPRTIDKLLGDRRMASWLHMKLEQLLEGPDRSNIPLTEADKAELRRSILTLRDKRAALALTAPPCKGELPLW